MKNKKMPSIRFKEFSGKWQEYKLGDLTDEFKSGTYIKADNIFEKGKYPVYGGNGIRGYTNTFNHSGDYAIIGRQGALSGNVNFSTNNAYFTEHAIAVKANMTNDTRFLYFLLYKLQLGKWVTQSAQPGLAVGTLTAIKTLVPNEVKEQQKIGALFKNLDKLISLRERELSLLKQQKKGFLQNMFPKTGEKKPEVRFDGFTEDWEERKLGDMTKIKTGSSDLQDADSKGIYPFFVRSEKVEKSCRYIYEGEAILIPGEGRLGEIYHYICGKFDYHQRVYKISEFDNSLVQGKFVLYELQKNFKRHAMKFTVKATVDSLRLPMLTEYTLKFPNNEEQQKIGNFFKHLDDIISLNQKELDLLKETKKGFLQKMFI